MTLAGALIVLLVGAVAAVVTVVLAVTAERKERVDRERVRLSGQWWLDQEWWPALSADERQWVLRNLADGGHEAASAELPSPRKRSTEGESSK